MLKKLHQHAIHGWEIELARSEKIRDVEGVAAVRTERSRVEGHAWWKGSRAPSSRDLSCVNEVHQAIRDEILRNVTMCNL